MSIEFENVGADLPAQPMSSQAGSTTVGWLMRKGFVKSERQAEYIIFGFCIICLTLAAYIVTYEVYGLHISVSLEKQQEQHTKFIQRRNANLEKIRASKAANQ